MNRSPLCTPEKSVSGTPGSGGSRCFHRRTATIIKVKKSALPKNALPEPSHAAMAPASAGPIARATLNATALKATARGKSARDTSSLMLACCAGM